MRSAALDQGADEIMVMVGKPVTNAVLKKHDGQVSDAARELGTSRSAWYRLANG